MTGFLEDSFLRSLFGFTDQDLADLNEILPDLENLVTVITNHVPQANRVLNKGLPLLMKVIAKEKSLK